MSSHSLRIGILLVLCAFTSCTASIKSESNTAPDLSRASESDKDFLAKTRQRYPTDQHLIGVGEGASEKAATELARADLIKQIRAEVRVTWIDLIRERNNQTEQEVSRLVETRVRELVKGIEVVDQWNDSRTAAFYSVVVLPKTEMTRILQTAHGQEGEVHQPSEFAELSDGIWMTAEGVVSLGDDTTVAEARTRSRDEARRKAVEQAVGTFVKGQTVVYNTQVAEDLVQSLVRGLVVEERVLDEGWSYLTSDSGSKILQYSTKIRAKVMPVRVEHRGGFTLKASLNKNVFQDGEEMQVTAIPTRDAYLHIFSVGQDDRVTVLYPNRFAAAGFVAAQKELVFPDEAQRMLGLRLRVFPPQGLRKGMEKIKLIATTKKIDLTKGTIHEGVFQVYSGKDSALVTDLLRELARLDESEWAEATIPYEIRR
jgi:Domain of unknown function (DUF4384)/LPP20 lipoprotein